MQLAYSAIGVGPTLVQTGPWLTHLEFSLENTALRHIYADLAREHTLFRYDSRGTGLSDWDVEELSLDGWVRDLAAVADAANLERFPLFGFSQGCAIAAVYAAQHPERVSRLVLYGGYAQGINHRPTTKEQKQAYTAMLTLTRLGWGQNDPTFRQLWTSQFMPEATKEQMDAFNELQRMGTSPKNAERYMRANAEIDVTRILEQIKAPTLVLHAQEDVRIPFHLGRALAANIPSARLVPLPGRNHIPLPGEPAFKRLIQEINIFLQT